MNRGAWSSLDVAPAARLARRLLGQARAAPEGGQAAASEVEPYCSVLDCGAAEVKALVVDASAAPIVLAAAREPAPPSSGSADADFQHLVVAAERALVAAEDAAGLVPRRLVLGVPGPSTLLGTGRAEAYRPRPASPLRRAELGPLLARAQHVAIAAAQRAYETEYGAATAADVLQAYVLSVEIDGQPLADPASVTGAHLQVTVAAVLARRDDARRLAALAETLDLELLALAAQPSALGWAIGRSGGAPAVVLDVGASTTGVVVAGRRGAEAAASFPLGGRDLELRVAAALGCSEREAWEAVRAHTAGATQPGAAGRTVRRLAEHHALIWREAAEIVLHDLGRERTLPAACLLCGGSAGLPELRRGLADAAWPRGLPFERPPVVRLLSPSDLRGVEDRSFSLPALQAVPVLCLAAAALRPAADASPLDQLLAEAGGAPAGRGTGAE